MGRPIELVLASGSPRRRELLSSLGWAFTVLVPSVDESLLPGESPGEAVKRLSREKAETVAKERPGRFVVAADTVVALGNRILGKPCSREEALEMLILLNGRTHGLYGRYGVFPGERKPPPRERTWSSGNFPKTLSGLRRERRGRRQGRRLCHPGTGGTPGGFHQGDYFNVVGLPLCRLSRMP